MSTVDIAAAAAAIVGAEHVRTGDAIGDALRDATEVRGLEGHADALALPADTEQVRRLVAWCYEHDVAIVPRGGGTGYAGGCVPFGGLVLSLERLDRVRSFDPLLWRIEVDAGVTTHRVQRLARESGLAFPPNPGAGEQSHIGGNIATNAGGPRAFKYGVTGAWVTGVEAVVAPGRIVRVGGPVRKDVAGFDLRSLLVGSEGALGIVTAAWLRLIPAVEAAFPVVGLYPDAATGCAAIEGALASGIVPSVIDYLDGRCVRIAGDAYPAPLPLGAAEHPFMVLCEADGTAAEARDGAEALREALSGGALAVYAPTAADEITALWRWREGVPLAVDGWRGGKISEDIGVPLDRLAEAIDETIAIGERHDIEACSWGHAGDGNLHSSFLFDRSDQEQIARAEAAAGDLFALAVRLGGTISGEHGTGLVKAGRLRDQWTEGAVALHQAVKDAFDPKGLFNPGKKRP